MNKLLLSLMLLISSVCNAQPPTTTFFNDQYGMPQGSATQSGNTTYFNNAYGMPTGSATQSGNTTFVNDAYGMPIGSSTTSSPITPNIQPIQNIQPLQPSWR